MRSANCQPGTLLVESFPHDFAEQTVFYGFAGRNGQQTLGLLLTKRMEDLGLRPLGFVATDYATLIWGLSPSTTPRRCSTPACCTRVSTVGLRAMP